MSDLFGSFPSSQGEPAPASGPLADRMRPRELSEIVGQAKALGPSSPLRGALAAGALPSLILWGPPGCGKTTLAACLARSVQATFLPYSAVTVGVKELKGVMADARRLRQRGGRAPVLFLDEIHRFNKAQQDALLPYVEAGDVVLIGATTENPSFEVNSALLSRARLIVLEPLDASSIVELLRRAAESSRGLSGAFTVEDGALEALANSCGGDARVALGGLELAAAAARSAATSSIDVELARRVVADAHLAYDKSGEEHFNLISALQKSVRNSDAQASLYWLARMLEAGEDPMYVARRLVRIASEDVGLADPRALEQAVAASRAVHQIGLPEGALALAQATVYLAQAPKSNALYRGYAAAAEAIQSGHRDPVPLHLRNAVTPLMRGVGYGQGYRYAHDEEEGVSAMSCLPDALEETTFYEPTDQGFEAELAERLRRATELARRHRRKT